MWRPTRPYGPERLGSSTMVGLSASERVQLISYVLSHRRAASERRDCLTWRQVREAQVGKALVSDGVVGAGGFEPPSSSVSAKQREPLCYRVS